MKKAALYSRVSTLEQANNGYSLNAQKEQLKNYAKAMNYSIVSQYSDGGHSGGNMDRPELKRMIQDIEYREIYIVIVVKLDRLSRNQRNTLYLIEDVFQKHDVGFISLQESFDTTTSFGRAMIGIISTFAQLERDTIYERMFMGRKERAKNGLYRGSANVATGYSYIDGNLFKNKDSVIVEEIFERYVDGDSAYAIFVDLANRYPGKIYGDNMITRILDNPIYTAKVKFDDEYFDGVHEPIVDEDTFNAAQQLRSQVSNKFKVDKTKRSSLLARKIYCGHCGKTLVKQKHYQQYEAKNSRREYHYGYYVCNGKRSRTVKKTGHKCSQPNKKVEDIDSFVLDEINSLDLEKTKNSITEKRKTDKSKTKMDDLDKQEKRMMDLYQIGSVDINELEARLKKIRDDKKQIKQTKSSKKEKNIIKKIESLKGVNMYDLEFEEQCGIIDTFIDHIIIKDDDIKIHFTF
ncbi:recombinase family protein [Desemzia sp. RIT804]|uniref:recombinase family protein n=1 Tax=Desemzia sp. RIT 804 TaxID=2810209 RepID=UPI00194DC421|nr:recombinase family protein [Desemzia sp. RIT 804]MBM6615588.1 recombinase family protein [Desemzia sp. RIT 804]